jgi:hypothetical protein
MKKAEHLYILWVNDNPITAKEMVFMYGLNSLTYGWWEKVTIIIWGATAKLINENIEIQQQIQELSLSGVKFSTCKACADDLGVRETLENLGVEVIYWGEPLTDILQSGEKLLTI